MEIAEYQNMYHAENSHFYYVSLHKLILQFIKQYRGAVKTVTILDAGCGTGRLGQLMKRYGTVTGIDMSDEALEFAKKRGLAVKKASVTKLPFQDNRFDVVTSIDVIVSKEVTKDTDALNEFYRVLKPGGILILRVSAIPWLNVSHDRFVHSNKRYSEKMLREKLENAGFTIERLSYMNMVLAPVGILQHFYENVFPPKQDHSSISKPNQLMNTIALTLLNIENSLLHAMNLPFGLGLVAVARKG